ncbi:hypothetical protein ILYODFUR_037339 [Ilyodon furcidens]|uniref:Uncharacterized protein n=1 Tax=Ilyodon furcidens TaxID=33524 RepID=A0ABV0SUY1_9TELE
MMKQLITDELYTSACLHGRRRRLRLSAWKEETPPPVCMEGRDASACLHGRKRRLRLSAWKEETPPPVCMEGGDTSSSDGISSQPDSVSFS